LLKGESIRDMVTKPRKSFVQGRLIGYARVSTEEQGTDPQLDELRAAGCETTLEEHASGADRSRPVLARLLREIRPGETLVVVRLDRLARSVSHLLAVIEQLEAGGAHFRSLHDPIDTSTPQGMFSLQVLGAVAQLERALIAERTKAGLKTARSRGRIGGNPGLRAGDPDAIRKVRASRAAAHLDGVLADLGSWLPTVQRMRPDQPWGDVVRVLNRGNGTTWTVERLRRTVRRLVTEGMVEATLLERARPQRGDDRLIRLVAGIKAAAPNRTLQQIAAQLESMHERTPRGGTRWHPSSVKHLLGRGARQVDLRAGTQAGEWTGRRIPSRQAVASR
jgi:DNA invertase Pin-like site-specific DNA recombinase